MKISENWLREWVSVDAPINDIGEQLTMAGLEVESIDPVAGALDKIVVAHVKEISKHPDADKLSVCKVDDGTGDLVQVVCGAPNVAQDQKVAFAQVGASLPNFKIKKAKLRGVESLGMLCSSVELGIAEESSGILVLPYDAPVGDRVDNYLKLNDNVLDISITPNRGDCISVVGIAREVAVFSESTCKTTESAKVSETIKDVIPVTVSSPDKCPRYLCRVVKNIDVAAQTPLWMKEMLRRSGIGSISPVVDITNYVMLELGQPMHAFDLAKVEGEIVVRNSQKGENLNLLSQQNVTLDDDTLVIADSKQVLAIAGIMGGQDSGVAQGSKDIILESAFFQPQEIAKTSRAYKLQSDACYRFERGVDPQLQCQAMDRASQLLKEIVGGKFGPVQESLHENSLPKLSKITLRSKRIASLLGFEIEAERVQAILSALGMKIEKEGDDYNVTPPSYRFDMAIEEDLIEELVRIIGFSDVKETPPNFSMQKQQGINSLGEIALARNALKNRDYHEVITYSFVDRKTHDTLTGVSDPIVLDNPISSELSVMRASLLPGLLNTYKYNVNRQQSRVRIFEHGLCFSRSDDIEQKMKFAFLISGDVFSEQWGEKRRSLDFFDIKSDVQALLSLYFDLGGIAFTRASNLALHPGQSATILYNDIDLGCVGKIHPGIAKVLSVSENIFMCELNFEHIRRVSRKPTYAPFSKFPENRRDIAILIKEEISAESLIRHINSLSQASLKDAYVFDTYDGEGVADGYKSYTIALIIQDLEKTLVDEDVAKIVKTVLNSLEDKFEAILRD